MSTRKEQTSIVARVLRPIAVGLTVGVLLCLALLLVAATVMASFSVPQAAVTPIAIAILALSAFGGGLVASRVARTRGLLYGSGCGLLLFVIAFVAGLGIESATQGAWLFLKLALALGCGAIGGIVGVNWKR